MSLTKHVCQRTKGRGHKLATFHTTLHMPQLALELGAPTHNNTDANESHHTVDKKTAARTSKQFDTFEISVANHSVSKNAVELGMEEIHNGLRRHNCYQRAAFQPLPPPEPEEPELTGPHVLFYCDESHHAFKGKTHSRMVGKEKYQCDDNTKAFMLDTAKDLLNDNQITDFKAFGTLKVHSPTNPEKPQLFHAMPFSKGKPWNDWAMFDLREDQDSADETNDWVAAQIKCFLDFRHLPEENATMQPPGIYAIIEPTRSNATNDFKFCSRLTDAMRKEPCTVEGFQNDHHKQQLVSIRRLKCPAVVVPDIGNSNCRACLRLAPKALWADKCNDWLEEHHQRQFEWLLLVSGPSCNVLRAVNPIPCHNVLLARTH